MGKRAIPNATRVAVALRYGAVPGIGGLAACHYCGRPGRIAWWKRSNGAPSSWVTFTLEMDHVIPEALGGTEDPDNIVLACRRCNRSKGVRNGPKAHGLSWATY